MYIDSTKCCPEHVMIASFFKLITSKSEKTYVWNSFTFFLRFKFQYDIIDYYQNTICSAYSMFVFTKRGIQI